VAGDVNSYLLVGALTLAVMGAIEDVRRRRIPNRLTYVGLLAAFVFRFFMLGWPGLKEGLLASLSAGGVLFLLFVLGGMGAGDVKLMAAVAGWAGTGEVVNLLIAASLAGGAMAVCLIIYRKRVLVTLQNTAELVRHHSTSGFQPHPVLNVREGGSMRLPFAPAIAFAALYCASRTFLWG